MAAALSFTDAQAIVTDLNDFDSFMVLTLSGAGMAGIEHHTQRTPLQDGETHIRTLLAPRFLIVELVIMATTFETLQTARRTLTAALNPKKGAGTLKYKPDPAGVEYGISCFIEQGADFSNPVSPAAEVATISFRCPDPAWYNTTPSAPTVVVPAGGLSIPISIPMSISKAAKTETITNAGDLARYPVITAPGPFSDPLIKNDTTGKYLKLEGLSVASGETLTVDMSARTVAVAGVSYIDRVTAESEFWPLERGANSVTITVESGGATFTVTYNTPYLGV